MCSGSNSHTNLTRDKIIKKYHGVELMIVVEKRLKDVRFGFRDQGKINIKSTKWVGAKYVA